MFRFKIDVIDALSRVGVTAYSARTSGLLSQSTFTMMKKGEVPALKSLGVICDLLRAQPGDLIEWVPDEK